MECGGAEKWKGAASIEYRVLSIESERLGGELHYYFISPCLEMRNLFVARRDKIADLLVLAADFGVDLEFT